MSIKSGAGIPACQNESSKAAAGKNACPTCCGQRREFLWQAGAGFAGLALTALLDGDGFFAKHGFAAEGSGANPLAPRIPHFAAKAKSVIFLFMYGGPSSM